MTQASDAALSAFPPARRWRAHAAPLFLLLALGLGLRLACLGQESLWADEYYTLWTANAPSVSEVLAHLAAADPHPPLYFLFMHGFLKLAGTSDVALRIPSVAAGAAGPLLLYGLALLLFPGRRGLALLAGALLAISPMHLWYSQEARSYAIQVALELAALAALARGLRLREASAASPPAARAPGDGWILLAVALAALDFGIHYFSLFICATVLATVFWFGLRWRLLPARLLVTATLIMALGMVFPLVNMLHNLVTGHGVDWLPARYGPGILALVARAQLLGPLGSPLPGSLQCAGLAAGLALAGAGGWAVTCARHRDPLAPALLGFGLLLTLAAPVLISFVHAIIYYGQRYLIIAQPFVMLLVAAGVLAGRRKMGRGAGLALLVFLVAGQGIWLGHHFAFRQKHTWDLVGDYLGRRTRAEESLYYVYPGLDAGLLARYLPGGRPVSPVLASAGMFQPMREALAQTGRRAFVVSYRDTRAWLQQAGIAGPFRAQVFRTEWPMQELWLIEVAPAAAPRYQ